jgi:hypothetical protein
MYGCHTTIIKGRDFNKKKKIMIKEITKLILGVIIVGGTVYSIITLPDSVALSYMSGIAGVVIGYYFKDVTGGVGAIFGRDKDSV